MKNQLMNKKKIYLGILGLCILLALFIFIDINQVINSIRQVDLVYFVIGIIITFVAVIIKAIRWKVMLKYANMPINFSESFRMICSANFLFLFMPNFSGDIYRAYALKKMKRFTFSKGLASSLFEKMIDFGVILILGIIWLAGYLLIKNIEIKTSIIISMAILFLGIIFLFLLIRNPRIITHILMKYQKKSILTKIYKTKIGKRFRQESAAFFLKLKSISKHRKILLSTTTLTIVSWGLYGIRFYILALALGIETSLLSAIGIYFLAISIGIISMTPGSFGSKEAIITFLLSIHGISSAAGLSLALVDRAVFFIVTAFFGIVFYRLNSQIHFTQKEFS